MKAILHLRQRYNKPPASSEGPQPRQGQVGGYGAGGSRKAADSMILYEKPYVSLGIPYIRVQPALMSCSLREGVFCG